MLGQKYCDVQEISIWVGHQKLKLALDQISEWQINENVNQKKNKMFSLTQMCKIWEKQSFMNIRRVSLSSPKLKKKKNAISTTCSKFL